MLNSKRLIYFLFNMARIALSISLRSIIPKSANSQVLHSILSTTIAPQKEEATYATYCTVD
jgi:hypothetical protein